MKLKLGPFSIAERCGLCFAAATLALAGASCIGNRDYHVYEAEYSAWAMELSWTHNFEDPTGGSDGSSGRFRFTTLKLVLKPNRVGEDQKIDGEAVVGTYQHGGLDWCLKPHRVTGTIRLLELGATDVRAFVDAVMDCPGAEPVALKGEVRFETKVPP